MMTADSEHRYASSYTRAIRVLIRYSLVMLVVGLLAGISYQESAKKLVLDPDNAVLSRWGVTLRLALVHGHLIVAGVLLPVAMAGMLHLARAYGGGEVSPRGLRWVIGTYLPFGAASFALMLYKAYHLLLSVRGGETDLASIDAAFLAGSKALRHGLYGFFHFGMGFGLCVFTWCLWRSMGSGRTRAVTDAR